MLAASSKIDFTSFTFTFTDLGGKYAQHYHIRYLNEHVVFCPSIVTVHPTGCCIVVSLTWSNVLYTLLYSILMTMLCFAQLLEKCTTTPHHTTHTHSRHS